MAMADFKAQWLATTVVATDHHIVTHAAGVNRPLKVSTGS
jgi:hypothetical protein